MQKVAIAFLVAILVPLHAAAEPLGPAVIAKATGNALIIWQATPEVAALTASGRSGEVALLTLKEDALRVMLSKRSAVDRAAHSISVSVLYARSAGVSPVYKADTFGGFEKLMTVTAKRSALVRSGSWAAQLASGKLPPGVTVLMTGALPPH